MKFRKILQSRAFRIVLTLSAAYFVVRTIYPSTRSDERSNEVKDWREDVVHIKSSAEMKDNLNKHNADPEIIKKVEKALVMEKALVEDKPERANAAFVILCRNEDISGVEKTLKNLEETFNSRFNYPYVFINNNPWTDEFKSRAKLLTKAKLEFVETLDLSWTYPSFINQTYAAECRHNMRHIIYGDNEKYRFYSGFFFRHPAVAKYEFYWRVEPDVEFYCRLDEDPFLFMKKNNKKYGYVIAISEYMETIPTLWKTVKAWMQIKKITVAPLLNFFLNDAREYNGAHFWSNFEIARTDLWNSDLYLNFFDYLDKTGGFFYERWGDAPVHSIFIAATLKTDDLHAFKNIGYYHPGFMQCIETGDLKDKCKCPKDKDNISEAKGYSYFNELQEYRDSEWRQ